MLGTSLLLLNATVGAAKIGMGRLGPHYATEIGSNEMFAGGDIFPSGHTANAVVTWGVLAYLATTPRARRIASVSAALLALGVGMTTVYLGTHWMSDVTLGWTAGLLVLLALPGSNTLMERAESWLLAVLGPAARAPRVLAPAVATAPDRGLWGRAPRPYDTAPAREPVGAASRAVRQAENRPGPRPGRTRPVRSGTPVTPGGSRRPPQRTGAGGPGDGPRTRQSAERPHRERAATSSRWRPFRMPGVSPSSSAARGRPPPRGSAVRSRTPG
ncbi:hypothetical protein GCM10020221_00360 [Streptomyces thioluteus]|uniref:Phosphatidic acid phosphatase type 2/haloperoxidase domain-containing protein n=1 Tax=Streptomyces thioluteus TaxID=66431 RepID=A0ABN3WAS3_STRTU